MPLRLLHFDARSLFVVACFAGCAIYDSSLLVSTSSDAGLPDGAIDASVGFTISAPPSITLAQGDSAPVTLTITRNGGFSDAISFTVSGLPAAASTSPLTITSDSTTGTLTVIVGASTPQSVSHLSIDGVAANGTISASAQMDLIVRGPPGSLDDLYGTGGIVSNFLTTTNFGTFDAATLDASDDVLIAIDSQLGGGDIFVIRIKPDGTLDSSFGAAGIATIPNIGVSFKAIFALASGEIELCGLSENGKPWTDEIVRLTAAGAIDTSFSPDGGVGYGILRSDGQPYVFTLDATGRIVETGFTGNATNFLLTRRTADGAADSTFDAGFQSTIGGPGGPTIVQPDGKIVASFISNNPPYAMGLVRTDDFGNEDSTFATNGVSPPNGPAGNPSALILQADGKFLAGGVTFTNTGSENPGGFVARYDASGTIDVTFANAGVAPIASGNVFAMAEQADNSVLTVGYPWPTGDAGASTNALWIERLTVGGVLDTSFGVGGTVSTPLGGAGEITVGEFVGVQPDGRIVVVAATMKSQGVYDFAVLRYWP